MYEVEVSIKFLGTVDVSARREGRYMVLRPERML